MVPEREKFAVFTLNLEDWTINSFMNYALTVDFDAFSVFLRRNLQWYVNV